ncbi:MAG: NADH-quinone oxidoreductase subunit L [Euryarchaeota archaeon]|jgi:NADH-quinone oxidoreductase subunit L|nr:NADH-quinone oxidoreductase subunit L [Euryarchaeota archaeon]
MSENNTSEKRFLPIIGLFLLFPFLRMFGGDLATGSPFTALDSAFLIPLIPIVIFPVIAILGQWYAGEDWWRDNFKEGGMIALCTMAISLSLTIWLAVEFFTGGASFHHPMEWSLFNWITFDTIGQDVNGDWVHLQVSDSLNVGLWIDNVSMMLLFVASFLCFLICWFSIGYMNTDPVNKDRNHRFYAEFVLFTAGMLGMVLADSFLWLFIFWEIMGLCSYLLIGFYYERPSAAYAAKKAFLTTRVGDVFLLIGLLMMYDIYGTLAFDKLLVDPSTDLLGNPVNAGTLKVALGMLFVGAVGKSAQFPLHVWLPDAMEGPTPVSALIHAATMVNAGLYLVARFVPFFDVTSHGHGVEGLEDLAILIAWIGGITAFMAALIAFVQTDIKKVLAYSTMSQLAYIFTGLGVALWFYNHGEHHAAVIAFGASMFHLFNHAMAKGMLFMSSGSVIHEMHHAHHHVHHDEEGHDDFDPQDMRNMGGLASKMPITATAMAIGSASIIGLPLIGGFWSKEGIVAETWNAAALHGGTWLLFPAFLILLTAGMTGFYMTRMWMMTFAGKPKSEYVGHVHEQTPWIPTPLVTLSVISLLGGFVLAILGAINWLGDAETLGTLVHEHGIVVAILETISHAFLPTDFFLFLVTWVTIAISLVVGPAMAMRIHGGDLKEGERGPQLISWIPPLSAKFGRADVSDLAESGLADALHRRLYFDELYEWAIAKTIIPLSHAFAWFDRRVIDGAVKGIEWGSQKISGDVRKITTGRASDYILMAVIGTFSILVLLWGVI